MKETKQVSKHAIVTVLLIGTFIAILNQTIMTTALPHLMEDLYITENTAQWLTTGFMLVNGIMIPVTAFLIQKYTTRTLFFTAMILFTAGTFICALSVNFFTLLVGRIVQASCAGIMMPLMQTVLFTLYPVEKRGRAMGVFGLVVAFAPAIGPTLSGWIIDNFDWRVLFQLLLPVSVFILIAGYFLLKNVTERTSPVLDVLSVMLSTIGFGGLLLGFSMAGSNGWGSYQVIFPLLIAVVGLYWFIQRQLKQEQAMLEFRVFKYKMFSLSLILVIIVFITFIGGMTILPIYMQKMMGYTAFESGLVLMPGGIVLGVLSPITGRIYDKVGSKWLAFTGLSLVTFSAFLLTDISAQTTFIYLMIVHAVAMVGNAMVKMPLTTAALNALPEELIPHGTAMNNTMRQVAGALGTAVLVTIMTNSEQDTTVYGVAGAVHGVSVAFIVVTCIGIGGMFLSLFIEGNRSK
ncbi:MDR family MFS transporter [Gracilibacillus salinarum]|uniref:DHA2 family efflux MFS transporter permease subunit n=1 Tax=Gracilibacillus salinarum TaxID=2932255 RepID=A0ABY4GQD4_9BACI|nr:MDR family MFS transporter [Gracilibacillus salinarum]UOQ86484.1 DHA2 family efflux MFS transporter permease subunit [Gracilibacillus salinarum]